MVTVCRLSEVEYSQYDEVWAIMRALKYGSQHIRHVPELSPSWELFGRFRELKEQGRWNQGTFQEIYVPQFLQEMRGEKQRIRLNWLFNTKKNICLSCVCPEQSLCHSSIIGGMLQGAGLDVHGLESDYSHYFTWWKEGVPGAEPTSADISGEGILEVHNRNVSYLYRDCFPQDDIATMCFTGRRPKDLCGYDAGKYRDFVSKLAGLIYDEFYVKRGVRRFITGGAQGFDQLSFWAVERMKRAYGCTGMENVLFVPFVGQESRWAGKGCFSKEEYMAMVRCADRVVVVCHENSVESMFERNHAMCDHSRFLLGLYPDDGWKVSRGGTAECLRYADGSSVEAFRLSYVLGPDGLCMGGMHSLQVTDRP